MSVLEIRALLDQLADPAYAPLFEDALALRATADDEGVDKPVRVAAGERARVALDELAADLAAEFIARELVSA